MKKKTGRYFGSMCICMLYCRVACEPSNRSQHDSWHEVRRGTPERADRAFELRDPTDAFLLKAADEVGHRRVGRSDEKGCADMHCAQRGRCETSNASLDSRVIES